MPAIINCGYDCPDWADPEKPVICTPFRRSGNRGEGREPPWEIGCVPDSKRPDAERRWGLADERGSGEIFGKGIEKSGLCAQTKEFF